jgi:hypothetical protein
VEILELGGEWYLFKILHRIERIERRIRIHAKPNEACSSAGLTRGFGFKCGGEREEASSLTDMKLSTCLFALLIRISRGYRSPASFFPQLVQAKREEMCIVEYMFGFGRQLAGDGTRGGVVHVRDAANRAWRALSLQINLLVRSASTWRPKPFNPSTRLQRPLANI